jgi:hypothetical protein
MNDIITVRRQNDSIIATINGKEVIVRKSGGSKYAKVSFQTGTIPVWDQFGVKTEKNSNRFFPHRAHVSVKPYSKFHTVVGVYEIA